MNVEGAGNSVNARESVVVGKNNTLTKGKDNVIQGDDNQLQGNQTSVIGTRNIVNTT